MQLKTTDKHFNDISTIRQTQQQCSTIKWLSSPLAWYQTLQSWSFLAWCRNKFLSWESWYTCRFHPHLTRRRNANVYKGYCTTTINEREGASCHCWRLRRVDKKKNLIVTFKCWKSPRFGYKRGHYNCTVELDIPQPFLLTKSSNHKLKENNQFVKYSESLERPT